MIDRKPWSDDRLAAAFAARADAAPPSAPIDLASRTIDAIRTEHRAGGRGGLRSRSWRPALALAAAAMVAALVIGTVATGLRLPDRPGGRGLVMFQDGPSADLRTLDAGEFAFDYPADWLAYDAVAPFSGGSSIAVLGAQAVEPRCGDERHVDINCVYEQPLGPGDVRVFVGTGAYRGGTVLDRPDVENGTTTRLTIGGMPAILDEFDRQPDSYYREDVSLAWSIGRPSTLTNVVRIEVRAREWPARGRISTTAEVKAAIQVLIDSFRFTPPAAPTDPPASTRPTTSTGPSAPAEVLGFPVMTVPDAIAVRDGGTDDRELAVRGWFSPFGPIACPAPARWPVSPVEPNCPDPWVVLMEQPESLATAQASGFEGRPPTGPSFQIDLDDLDAGWQPTLPALGPAVAIEIVVVGHFDDRRSMLCPDEVEAACRDRFVVDRVDRVSGAVQPRSVVDLVDGDEASTLADVTAVVANETSDNPILSIAAVDGPTGIGRIEPSLGTGRGGFIDQRAIWVVRVLEDNRAVTYLVVDGTDAIFEMNAEGVPGAVGGSLQEPSAPPWPPEGATIITLTSQVGAGRPPARVAVLDKSGKLVSVREVTPQDPPTAVIGGSQNAALTVDVHGAYRLDWGGGPCDGDMTVTIEFAVKRIVVDGGRVPACDSMGIGRALVLTFTEPIRPDDVTVDYIRHAIGSD